MQQRAGTETSNQQESSGLNRAINLTATPLHWATWGTVLLLALVIRLPGRTNWPLSAGESAIARDAWALLHGNDLSAAVDTHPVMVQLTALSFFLFGDTDYTARLVPLIAGLGIIITLFWLRAWFGDLSALSIAIVWSVSPVMTMSTLRIDGGAVLLLAMLLVLSLTMTSRIDPSPGKAILLGVAIALGLTSHPLGWVAIPLTVLPAMLLVRDFRLGGQLLTACVSFIVTLLVITSWVATRPSAIPGFFKESLSAIGHEHLARFGADWQAPLIVMLVDEPVILLLGAIGAVVTFSRTGWDISAHPAIFVSCIAWAVPLFTAGLLLSGKGPALYAVTLLPLIVLAGFGLSMLIDGVRKSGWQRGHPALWAAVALALLIAIIRFAEILARGPEGDAAGWLVSAFALGLLILLPLGYATVRLVAGTGWTLVPVTLLSVVLIVGAVGLRTSLHLQSTAQDRPGEILHAGSSTPAVGHIEHRLRVYSRDITTYIQDVRDPDGGHGLFIAVEEDLADPFAWYFRDFPNLMIVAGVESIPEGVAPDAAFVTVDQRDAWEMAFGEHAFRNYPIRYGDTGTISESTYNGLLFSAVNPLEYRDLLHFAIYRSNPNLLEWEHMVLILREDHAEAIWSSPPEASEVQ